MDFQPNKMILPFLTTAQGRHVQIHVMYNVLAVALNVLCFVLRKTCQSWCHWNMSSSKATRKRTLIIRQFSFAVGHVINDVTRLLMLSYRLVFLMKVVNMSASNAGWIMVFSRVSNAIIIRPIAGYLCDKVSIPVLSHRHGKRKSWHMIGIVLQVVSMPLLFSNCLVCSSEPSQWELIAYYGIINTLGWISIILIETAHLSLIPFIAKDQKEAVKLNGLRFENCLIYIQIPNLYHNIQVIYIWSLFYFFQIVWYKYKQIVHVYRF